MKLCEIMREEWKGNEYWFVWDQTYMQLFPKCDDSDAQVTEAECREWIAANSYIDVQTLSELESESWYRKRDLSGVIRHP